MASRFAPKLLSFNIIYDDNEAKLELYNYDTVGDLKERISNTFNISPDQQSIHCWYQTPNDDNTILDYCCEDTEYSHTLIVGKKPPEELEINRNVDIDSMDTSKNYRELENAAVSSFVQYFSNNYNSSIAFHICCLNDAIQEACLTSIKSRKILLLYFHNKSEEFSKIFCRNLAKADIQTLLSTNYFLLGWDVENDQYRDGLKFALNQSRDLSNLLEMIEAKVAAALLIVPIKNSISIYSCMRGKVKDSDILTTIKEAEKFFKIENNVEENLEENTNEDDIGSENFQQLMLDLLGDRDYDSFDYDEHDSLKNKIGYALYGPPKQESGYNDDEKKEIDRLYQIIVKQNNLIAKWTDRVIISFVYVCLEPLPNEQLERKQQYPDYNPKTDIMPLPIFILRKCKNSPQPCRIFIDYTGRVYRSWIDFIQNNKLHKCCMVLPKDGRYQADENGHILLERHLSPACGLDVKVLQGVDIASTVIGVASGGVFVAAAAIPAVVVAPAVLIAAAVTGAAVGTYSLVRSAISLADRHRHKESMSFANSEARGAYINILAGSLGFVGAGASIAVTQLATQGFQIGRGATAVVNVINVANITAGGAGIINSGYDVINQWITDNRTPSLLTMVQLGSSVLFFGHALYSFRTAGAIIEESQTNALKDIQASLRSNRHRKTFNKLLKETIRQNGDNVQKGRAEVISTIRNIKDRNEVMAALTRSNSDMKRYNVKFTAANGEICLNGIQIDMETFTTLDRTQRITFLQQFSTGNIEQPSYGQINSIKFKLRDICPNFTTQDLTNLAFNVARMFLGSPEDVKDKIMNAVHTIIEYLTRNCPNYLDLLDSIFPKHQRYFEMFLMVTQCFQNLVNQMEQQYQLWLDTGNDEYRNPLFSEFTSGFCKRALQIFQLITKTYFIGTSLNEQGLKLLIEYFYTWFAKQIDNHEDRQKRIRQRSAHSTTATEKVKCDKCGGECYQPLPK